MNAVEEIFQEYVRIREYGLGVHEALRALMVYVEPLDIDLRQQLAGYLRSWEAEKLNNPDQAPRKISQLKHFMPHPTTSEFSWLKCRHCGKKSLEKKIFCNDCGAMLQDGLGEMTTLDFQLNIDQSVEADYFASDSLLVLSAKNAAGYYELRPQLQERELILGRDPHGVDINLGNTEAIQLGVSRLHLGILYNEESKTLLIHDLGSANGTFINGQRVHPSERRTLRHGDELTLGRLQMEVEYLHAESKRK